MRFLLKIVFWLALIAFFLPSFGGEEANRDGVNPLGAFVGAQQAISDLGGFCERAPAACAAGRDVGSYVAGRVGDGLAYGYAAVHGRATAPEEPARTLAPASPARRAATVSAPTQSSPATAPAPPSAPAAFAAQRVREAAGLAPFAMPMMPEKVVEERTPSPAIFVHAGNARSIPAPTPRP